MVKLDKIRSDLESQLQIDKSLHYVDVRADTLEEALSDASVQLGVKISCLEYEVLFILVIPPFDLERSGSAGEEMPV